MKSFVAGRFIDSFICIPRIEKEMKEKRAEKPTQQVMSFWPRSDLSWRCWCESRVSYALLSCLLLRGLFSSSSIILSYDTPKGFGVPFLLRGLIAWVMFKFVINRQQQFIFGNINISCTFFMKDFSHMFKHNSFLLPPNIFPQVLREKVIYSYEFISLCF